MQLSAELYSQIIKDLVSDGLGEFGRQQRREPRVGVRAKAYILPSLSAATPIPVRVRDISVGGMGLLLPRDLGAAPAATVNGTTTSSAAEVRATVDEEEGRVTIDLTYRCSPNSGACA